MATAEMFEASGKLKRLTPEELAEADKNSAILCYSRGTMKDGTPYYAFIGVRPSRYAEYRKNTLAEQPMLLGEYGIIVAAGFEEAAPMEVLQEMRDKYGYDEKYAEKLVNRLVEEQKLFFKRQEDNRIMDVVAMLKKKQVTGNKS